ncbi:peptide chain release factor 3 [Microbacterium sp. LRZ72]|uniref:peptide chain release factor 3 n=1 Tax=Microbacterium sp. LRZ72 TaxID=2942481 RepID=UPI0029B10A73|nr:peptide chain release factor 3 [Microbacterium sp. LRZ72]MDX2376594.1 peptide chain release factor 3 [Microbacterium sp. LRZ72]
MREEPQEDRIEQQRVVDEAARRRTIAVISHPDAGKSTLSEAMLLHARAISQAGATHGKAGRRGTVSDWMEMEQARGISISSAAIQFEVGDVIVNLVDTPGHADFSEDTYRVLAAVDAAVMLIDAAKGMEAQTVKLFDVCADRGIPIVAMINKWDRPGKDALELMDEVRDVTGMRPMPLTWPVGMSGHMVGLRHVESGDLELYERTAGGAQVAESRRVDGREAEEVAGADWSTAVDESELVTLDGGEYDRDAFLDRTGIPVLFGSAVQNIGVAHLLDFVRDEAPAARPRLDVDGNPRAVTAGFSAQVFKIQANMDPAHRDRLAFLRVCSGVFERGMTTQHAQSGRPFATKYAQQMFGQERQTVEQAWPGDIVGLVNASSLRPGDTLHGEDAVRFAGMPRFAPEVFALASPADSSTAKKFRKGIAQLAEEGVVQLLESERRGVQTPMLGAVGEMQFEVAAQRMQVDFSAAMRLSPLPYTVVCRVDPADVALLEGRRDLEIARRDDEYLALFADLWRLRALRRDMPDLVLEPLGRAIDEATGAAPRRA